VQDGEPVADQGTAEVIEGMRKEAKFKAKV
jgi:hypothetical protein